MLIADALRLLRDNQGLTQAAAVRRVGVPDVRTLSLWETGRKAPGVKLLYEYLRGLGLDLCDLQDALNELDVPSPTGCRVELERLGRRVEVLERQMGVEDEHGEAEGDVGKQVAFPLLQAARGDR